MRFKLSRCFFSKMDKASDSIPAASVSASRASLSSHQGWFSGALELVAGFALALRGTH
jgi:hypothetical protein